MAKCGHFWAKECHNPEYQKMKEKINKLEYTIMGIMHSVDKWIDNADDSEDDEVNRAAQAREIALQAIEKEEAIAMEYKEKNKKLQDRIDKLVKNSRPGCYIEEAEDSGYKLCEGRNLQYCLDCDLNTNN